MTEWISVEERLPEEPMVCLVMTAWENRPHARFISKYFEPANVPGRFFWGIEFGSTQRIKVTHWMPLPDPPEATDDR